MQAKKNSGTVRQFRIASQSWYSRAVKAVLGPNEPVDTIHLEFKSADRNLSGEFRIDWEPLGSAISARLKAYDDGWAAVAQFQDVLVGLGELSGSNPTVEQVVEVLLTLGVVDATERSPAKGSLSAVTPEDAERTAQLYRANLKALEGLRKVGREQAGDSSWAVNAEYGADFRALPAVDATLYSTIKALGEALVSHRARLDYIVDILADSSLTAAYKDVLAEAGQAGRPNS